MDWYQLFKQAAEFEQAIDLHTDLKNFEENFDFQLPMQEDKQDLQILINRALRGGADAIKYLTIIDKFVRKFKHEAYTSEFLDFISDQDMFDWLEQVNEKQSLSEFDKGYLYYILQDLKGFAHGNVWTSTASE